MTQPATDQTQPITEESENEPYEEWKGDENDPSVPATNVTQPTTAPEVYNGNFTLTISPDSPLFESKFVQLYFFNPQYYFSRTLILKPTLNGDGNKTVTFNPLKKYGISLYCGKLYEVTVRDYSNNRAVKNITIDPDGNNAVQI